MCATCSMPSNNKTKRPLRYYATSNMVANEDVICRFCLPSLEVSAFRCTDAAFKIAANSH